jgi:isopenicillin-N N-acyltransferase-like protein
MASPVKHFPFFQIAGGPYERGRQHGEQAADLIRFNLDGYWRLFQHYAGLDRPAALAAARLYSDPIRLYTPHLLQEMEGIAAGAGLSLEEVLALNCRTELLSTSEIPLCQECTAIFAAPERTAGGHTLLAQNWDWYDILRGGMILLRIAGPGRPTVLTLTEAGMVGKIGLNSAGIGVCTNFLRHDQRRLGLPFHLMLREMLEAPRLGLAVAAAYRAGRADAGNYLLAHADGEGINLEAAPASVAWLHPRDGLLVHTNHFLVPRLQEGDTGILESDNTLIRYGRAVHLLQRRAGALTVEMLMEILRDHFDRPKSICRHPDPTLPRAEQSATLASMVLDLTAARMYVAVGEPCQGDYYSVDLT